MAGKSTPGMSDFTRSAQHVKLVADLRQKTDSFEKSGSVDNMASANGIYLADHRSLCRACMWSFELLAFPTCFSPLTFETPVELITRGVGYTCAVDVQHCYRSFAQVPRDREVTSNSDYRSRCLVELYAT